MSVHDDKETARLAAEARSRGLPEWAVEAARAVPTDLVRSLVSDFSRPVSQNLSQLPDKMLAEQKPRAPSGGTVELKPPPGVALIDAMCIAQDRRDRADAIRREREAELVLRSQQSK